MKYYVAREKDQTSDQWLMQDIESGEQVVVATDEVKKAIARKSVHIINLQLSSDGKLIKQGQFKFNLDSVKGIINAPTQCKEIGAEPCSTKDMELFESSMDIMIKTAVTSLEHMTDGCITGKVLDADKNLFVISVKVLDYAIKKDKYLSVLVRYEQALNCNYYDSRNDQNLIVGDILLGVRALILPEIDVKRGADKVYNFDTGIASLANHFCTVQEDSGKFYLSNEICIRNFEEPVGPRLRKIVVADKKEVRSVANNGHLFLLDSEEEVIDVARAIVSCVLSMMTARLRDECDERDVAYGIASMMLDDMIDKEQVEANKADNKVLEGIKSVHDSIVKSQPVQEFMDAPRLYTRVIASVALMLGGAGITWLGGGPVEGVVQNMPMFLSGLGAVAAGGTGMYTAIKLGDSKFALSHIKDYALGFLGMASEMLKGLAISASSGSGYRRRHGGPRRNDRPSSHGSHTSRR